MIWRNLYVMVLDGVWYWLLAMLLPSFILKKYVKNKSLTGRLFFYQCLANLYIGFAVIALGYLKLVNRLSILVVVVILPLAVHLIIERAAVRAFADRSYSVYSQLVAGTIGGRYFLYSLSGRLRDRVKSWYRANIRGKELEIIILAALSVWIVYFYGWAHLTRYSYTHADEETHLYWIGQLLNGNIFPAGMYPHGLHTVIAAIVSLSGMNFVRAYLNFAMVSTLLIFHSCYCMLRKFVNFRYAALIGFVFFTLSTYFNAFAYTRLQTAFPMEFGLISCFTMVYAMLTYMETHDKRDVFLFGAAIAWSLLAHFYVTILCAFIVLAFGIVYIIPILKNKLFRYYFLAGVLAIVVSAVPYIAGYAMGYEFERSIGWALSITEESSGEADEAEASVEEADAEESDDTTDTVDKEAAERYMATAFYVATRDMSPGDKLKYALANPGEFYSSVVVDLTCYYFRQPAYVTINFLLTAFALLYGLIGAIVSKGRGRYLSYLFFAIAWLICIFVELMFFWDMTVLVHPRRMAVFAMFFNAPLLIVVPDALAALLKRLKISGTAVSTVYLCALAALVVYLALNNMIRRDRYYSVIMNDADAELSMELVSGEEDFTWTVISPTNDMSMIRYNGYHYEITDLLRSIQYNPDAAITIPTKYIYVVSEKTVLDWTNSGTIEDVYAADRNGLDYSVGHIPVSKEDARKDIDWTAQDEIHVEDYPYYYFRPTLMSRFYYWMEEVKEVYGDHIEVYYEDDDVIIYKITQDPYFLLNLNLDYSEQYEQ